MNGLLEQMLKESGIDANQLKPQIKDNCLEFDIGEAELRDILFKKDPRMANVSNIAIVNNRIKITFKLL